MRHRLFDSAKLFSLCAGFLHIVIYKHLTHADLAYATITSIYVLTEYPNQHQISWVHYIVIKHKTYKNNSNTLREIKFWINLLRMNEARMLRLWLRQAQRSIHIFLTFSWLWFWFTYNDQMTSFKKADTIYRTIATLPVLKIPVRNVSIWPLQLTT